MHTYLHHFEQWHRRLSKTGHHNHAPACSRKDGPCHDLSERARRTALTPELAPVEITWGEVGQCLTQWLRNWGGCRGGGAGRHRSGQRPPTDMGMRPRMTRMLNLENLKSQQRRDVAISACPVAGSLPPSSVAAGLSFIRSLIILSPQPRVCSISSLEFGWTDK